MSQDEAPKLYTNKPKKAQIKQHVNSKPTAATVSYQMGSQPQVPPPQPPKESFARRYKFLWPLLLTVNLGVGAYLFVRTKKKDTGSVEEYAKDASPGASSTVPVTPAADPRQSVPSESVIVPPKPREPIPENQQRELFKWILEEKRKLKPKDPEEKKRINEEKAILKEFIRAKSIPSI